MPQRKRIKLLKHNSLKEYAFFKEYSREQHLNSIIIYFCNPYMISFKDDRFELYKERKRFNWTRDYFEANWTLYLPDHEV